MESPASPDDIQLHDDGAADEGCYRECKTQFKGTAQRSSLPPEDEAKCSSKLVQSKKLEPKSK